MKNRTHNFAYLRITCFEYYTNNGSIFYAIWVFIILQDAFESSIFKNPHIFQFCLYFVVFWCYRPDHINDEILIYHVLLTLQPVYGQSWELIFDFTHWGPDNRFKVVICFRMIQFIYIISPIITASIFCIIFQKFYAYTHSLL